jgi:hypothetical protein
VDLSVGQPARSVPDVVAHLHRMAALAALVGRPWDVVAPHTGVLDEAAIDVLHEAAAVTGGACEQVLRTSGDEGARTLARADLRIVIDLIRALRRAAPPRWLDSNHESP